MWSSKKKSLLEKGHEILNDDVFGAGFIKGNQIRKWDGKIVGCGLFNLASGSLNQDMKIWYASGAKMKQISQIKH